MTASSKPRPEACVGLVDTIVNVVRSVVGPGAVPLHEPCFRGREHDYVGECLATGWVSSVGAYVARFEEELADAVGCRYAVATSSGTAALHTCLMVLGIGRGDEVLVPALSFVATANAVTYTGATPHFVDCEETTLGMDPVTLEAHLAAVADVHAGTCRNRRTGRSIRAVVPVHMFGHPCRSDAIADVAARFHLTMLEDAAESLGSSYRGRQTGCWGRLAAASFNGNKIITTGGGGAVLTDDEELAAAARHLTTTAKVPHPWAYRHDRVGYNYRLPNLNAALGCAQLEQLPRFVASKRRLASRYAEGLGDVAGVRFCGEPPHTRSNYWLCTMLLGAERAGALEPLLEAMRRDGIAARPCWTPLPALPMYAGCPRSNVSTATSLARRLVNLPSSPGLCLDDL